jgi:hypothetical protein
MQEFENMTYLIAVKSITGLKDHWSPTRNSIEIKNAKTLAQRTTFQ